MPTEPAPDFRRVRRGYDPTAVDAFIALLRTTEQSLRDEVALLHTRLAESATAAAELTHEVERLQGTSPSTDAMTRRISGFLQTALDEVSAMQAEARAEITKWAAVAKAEADQLLGEARDDAS